MLSIPSSKSHRKVWADRLVEPAGSGGSSPCLSNLRGVYGMPSPELTRRAFLIAGTLAAGTLAASRAAALPSARVATGPRTIYRLSLRGRRGSKAGKLHNANLRFATAAAADANRAHPGDRSRIVALTVSEDEFDRLFSSRDSAVADLRSLRGPVLVGDCNRNKQVVIEEVRRGVEIALEQSPVAACTPFDRVADGRVQVYELIRGVRNLP